MRYEIPRIMIAAPKSGSGKTLLSCGIMRALSKEKKVSAFKCGPDYIDPMFHEKVLHTPSKNLDTYFTNDDLTCHLLANEAIGTDIAVIEGVMGYYDGLGGVSSGASSYDVARATKTPVVLVVDGRGTSVSVVAMLKGFLTYQEPSQIEGVIFNKITEKMYPRLKELVEKELPLKVYGYLPKMEGVEFKSRHLGLVEPDEMETIDHQLYMIGMQCEATVDIEGLVQLANKAPVLNCRGSLHYVLFSTPRVRLAVAKDEAFSFYYKDNLNLLESLGAELVYFSPLRDAALPENVHGLILGGGYPELHAGELAENISMKASIYSALEDGMPCIAECGGFLYLQESLRDLQGEDHVMVGYLPGQSRYVGRLQHFGYLELRQKLDHPVNLFGMRNFYIRGHEFHYMASSDEGRDFIAQKPITNATWECGYMSERMYAGFPHLYLYSNIEVGKRFIKVCRQFKKEQEK